MINYNERLDDIFAPLIDRPSLALTTTYWNEAKQALTSLIKELVADAKPVNFSNAAMTTDETNWYGAGYNHAIDEFEKNLLKALEEK